jgi:hypothetical protein
MNPKEMGRMASGDIFANIKAPEMGPLTIEDFKKLKYLWRNDRENISTGTIEPWIESFFNEMMTLGIVPFSGKSIIDVKS